MKLSELVYLVVKNVKYLEDAGFTYQAFVSGEYDSDQDYANTINNAYTPINEAIHRLSDRNKIAFRTQKLNTKEGGLVDYFTAYDVKKVKAVFCVSDGDYYSMPFREMGKGKILIMGVPYGDLYIQYAEDIKNFSSSSEDEDLVHRGINETMCSYIIEYAQGKLQEPIAPELANMHRTIAEQYFDDLDEQQTPFCQKKLNKVFRIV